MKLRVLTAALGALALLGTSVGADRAHAGACTSSDSCTLYFTQGNSSSGFGTSPAGTPFGSVTLTKDTVTINNSIIHAVDVAISLQGFVIVNTGFPQGSGTNYGVAFNDTLGGGLGITNFSINSSNTSTLTSLYSGSNSTSTASMQFDGFGSFDDAAATFNSNQKSDGSSYLFFQVYNSGLTNVADLVAPSSGNPAFVVDVLKTGTSNTGLLGAYDTGSSVVSTATPAPEPATLAVLASGLFGLGLARRRRRLS